MKYNTLLGLAITMLVLSASQVSCADYSRISTPHFIYETVHFAAGDVKTIVKKQPADVTKIFRLITENSHNKNPLKLAELIAYNAKRPLLMAAMGLHESHFKESARSRCGAVSIWQLMPEWHWPGYSPYDNAKNLAKAEEVLEIKTKEAGGDLHKGVERYNGVGKEAVAYRKNVLRTYEELKAQKV